MDCENVVQTRSTTVLVCKKDEVIKSAVDKARKYIVQDKPDPERQMKSGLPHVKLQAPNLRMAVRILE